MRNTAVIAAKEFRTYFRTPIAFVFLTFFLVFTGWYFFWMGSEPFFKRGIVEMRTFFGLLPVVYLFFIPAFTMRAWSEERKQGTMEVLLTLPVREGEVVAGKFFAAAGLLVTALLFTAPVPVILCYIGTPEFGPIWGGYAGAFLLGAAYLSIGLFTSSLTENQIVAFILGLVFCFVFTFFGIFSIQGILPAVLETFFTKLSLSMRFHSIQRGVLDSRDVLYYVSVILFFLYLNVRIVRYRR